MSNVLLVAKQVVILFALMGFGAFARRARLVTPEAMEGIVNLLILVVTPCLIVNCFQRPFDPAMLQGLGIAFVFAALTHVASIALAKVAVRHRSEDTRHPLRLAAVFSNAGFMGIPLEQALLGDRGVFFGAVYIVVFNLFMWSWGLRTMRAGSSARESRFRMYMNPGSVGIAFGLPLFLFSLRLPDIAGEPVRQMSNLNTPLAMVVIGYFLAGAKLGRVARMPGVYAASAIRLVACPLLAVAALYPFRMRLDADMMMAMVIAASAPVAAMVSMFAAKYGRDVDTSVALVSGTTLLSVVTMPPVIALAFGLLA